MRNEIDHFERAAAESNNADVGTYVTHERRRYEDKKAQLPV